MINTDELKRRNLIEYIGKVYAVEGLNRSSIFINDMIIDSKVVNPIPLIPEWLERCGFEKLNAGWINSSGSVCFYDRARDMDGYYTMDYGTRNYVARFKYLHQLQNLFFALTGEELTINHEHLQSTSSSPR